MYDPNPFEVYVDLDEEETLLRWHPGARSLYGNDRQFMDWLCREFVNRFRMAIQSQQWGMGRRFENVYLPLSDPYMRWKRRHNLKLGFWECTGQIAAGIRAIQVGRRQWKIGWDKRRTYRNPVTGLSTGVRIWAIVLWLEYGTRKMPARPLIQPLLRNMRKEVTRLYVQYLRAENILTEQEIQEFREMNYV